MSYLKSMSGGDDLTTGLSCSIVLVEDGFPSLSVGSAKITLVFSIREGKDSLPFAAHGFLQRYIDPVLYFTCPGPAKLLRPLAIKGIYQCRKPSASMK